MSTYILGEAKESAQRNFEERIENAKLDCYTEIYETLIESGWTEDQAEADAEAASTEIVRDLLK